MGDQQHGDRALRDEPAQVGGDHDRASGEPVRDDATDQKRPDQRDHPDGEHEADVGRRAAQPEHREGQRDRHHPIPEPEIACAPNSSRKSRRRNTPMRASVVASGRTAGVDRLETPRLLLRPFAPRDAEIVHAIYSDPSVMRYVATGPMTDWQ